jgi:phage terminase large subunit GpA-like protein
MCAAVPSAPTAAPQAVRLDRGQHRPAEGTSALPGRIRLWPYQREIADAISDPIVERVTLVKGVRLGFTTLLTGAIGLCGKRAGGCPRRAADRRRHPRLRC